MILTLVKDVSFSCAIVVFANMHHRIIFSIRANNVSFQTAIVKVLHVPCSVHEPLARGSVNYKDAHTHHIVGNSNNRTNELPPAP